MKGSGYVVCTLIWLFVALAQGQTGTISNFDVPPGSQPIYHEAFNEGSPPQNILGGILMFGQDEGGIWTGCLNQGTYELTNSSEPDAIKYFHLTNLDGNTAGAPLSAGGASVEVSGRFSSEPSGAGLLYHFNPETRFYYAFILQEGQTWRFYKRNAEGFQEVVSGTSSAIRPDGPNRLTIVSEGSDMRLYVNEELLATVGSNNPDGIPPGGVGILALGTGTFNFDNFMIYNPQSQQVIAQVDFDSALQAYHAGDYETAWQGFLPLAEQGNPEAQTYVGLMYERGDGVQQNYKEAWKWYRKAAGAGETLGQFKVGLMYATGRGVEKSYESANYWLRKAAEAGNQDAQIKLGANFQFGNGVEHNLVEAYAWYSLANLKGHEIAADYMERLKPSLSEAELAAAQARAAELAELIASGRPTDVASSVTNAPPPTASASTNPLTASNPANDPLTGTFANAQLTLQLQRGNGQYSGQLLFNGQSFLVTAQGQGNSLTGTFQSGGGSHTFTATVQGETLTFVTDGVSYVLQKQATNSPTPPGAPPATNGPSTPGLPPSTSTAGFTTYQDRNHGFRIDHPADWRVHTADWGATFRPLNSPVYVQVDVTSRPPGMEEPGTLHKVTALMIRVYAGVSFYSNFQVAQPQDITVAGMPATLTVFNSTRSSADGAILGGDVIGFIVVIVVDDEVYTIMGEAEANSFQQYESVFNQMLSSFAL